MSSRRLLPIAVLFFPLLSLAACETPTPAQRRALDAMVGRTPTDLVRTFGVPTRTYTTDGHSFLAYIDNQTNYIPGSAGPGAGWGWGGYGWGGYGYGYGLGPGWAGGFPSTYYTSSCQTIFEVADDRVTSWSMRGDGC